MFCTNCGAQLPDNARFCSACGAVLQQAPQTVPVNAPVERPYAQNQQQNLRAEALQIMSHVVSLIPAIEPDWNLCRQLEQQYDRLNNARVRKGLILPFMIPGGIITILFGLFLLAVLDNGVKNSAGAILFFLFIGIALLGVGVFFLIFDNKRVKRFRKQAADVIPQMEACADRMYNVYAENQLQEVYPFNYFFPECILEINNNIQNFRADSIKEAINVYEQSQFYQSMLITNAQMVQMMEYTARQAAGANRAAAASAAFSAASFFMG